MLLDSRIRVDNEEDIISRSLSALDLIVDLFYKREDLARYESFIILKQIDKTTERCLLYKGIHMTGIFE